MEKLAAPRGTADLYPPQSATWLSFESRARAVARRYGYGEIRTPTFEATELFVRGVGETTDIVEREMYTFADKGGRSLTLRPEFTAPVVRAVLEHNLLSLGPQRYSYVGSIYRYERPQAGRYREAHQFGVECFGYAGPEADAEVIGLAADVLREHGLDVPVRINSIGDDECRPRYRAKLIDHFAPHRAALSDDSQRRLDRNPLRILDSKEARDLPFVASAPTVLDVLCERCRDHFAAVRDLLDATGVRYVVDPRLVRGLDYYTRTVFEFVSDDLGAQSTLAAGGRYDGLVETLGGPPTPAVGFAMGIERFTMILAKRGADATQRSGLAVLALGDRARRELAPLVAQLRRRSGDVAILTDYGDAKLATMFKRADRTNARAALVVGDEELDAKTLVLRDLVLRDQQTFARDGDDAASADDVLRRYAALAPAAATEAA